MFKSIITYGLVCHAEHEINASLFKQRTIAKWQESAKLPRKQKKKVRKSLKFDFLIIRWGEEVCNF